MCETYPTTDFTGDSGPAGHSPAKAVGLAGRRADEVPHLLLLLYDFQAQS